jgi:hypothetical protein
MKQGYISITPDGKDPSSFRGSQGQDHIAYSTLMARRSQLLEYRASMEVLSLVQYIHNLPPTRQHVINKELLLFQHDYFLSS